MHAQHDTLVPAQLTAACLVCKGGCLTSRPLPLALQAKENPASYNRDGVFFWALRKQANPGSRAGRLAGRPLIMPVTVAAVAVRP